MKTRIVGTVICFNFEEEKYKRIEDICRKSGNKIKKASSEDFLKPVGNLIGFSIEPYDSKDTAFDGELMLLYNFQSSDLNRFLNTLRSKEIDVPLKAMLTDTNKTWLPKELFEAIKTEHEQMTR